MKNHQERLSKTINISMRANNNFNEKYGFHFSHRMATIGLYRFTTLLGSGAFGNVWECEHLKTKEMFACKVMDIDICLQDDIFAHFKNELVIHSKVKHPGITQLRDVMIDGDKIYVFLELCQGGNLAEVVEDSGGLSEQEAKRYFFQIMSAIAYLHELHVAHRDIKLENILITAGDCAKLSDFGLCKQASEACQMVTTCGTLLYAAPEIINEVPYNGMKIDIWSSGIVLYTMVANHFPWETDEDMPPDRVMQETARQIVSGEISMPDEFSYELQNLLSNMLELDPDSRPTAKEILEHPWLEGEEDEAQGMDTKPDQELVEKVESIIAALDAKKEQKGKK